MYPVATATAFSNIVANLNSAQSQVTTISNQVSSGENATDLKGYASHAETLTAMQNVLTQTTGYIGQSQIVAAKLSSQDTGLGQLNDSASGAVTSITQALATGSGSTLMQSLQNNFQNAISGLNTTYNGEYVFSGGQVNTPATSATTLTALASAPSISGLFNNDQHVATAQVGPNTTVQTGQLGGQLGTALFTAYQAVAAYNAGPNGPFTDPLTTAQITFLQGQIPGFKSASTGLTNDQAQNGLAQQQVTTAQTDLNNQQTTLSNLIGNITNVNMAQAAANLTLAQNAVQASGRAFEALQSSSLLAVLTATGH